MQKITLEAVVFSCGAAVMILELAGSRLLAPYVGTSIFVWTSLIGIILGSLSLGYWWGGRLSDQRPEAKVLSAIILIAALWIGAVALSSDIVLVLIESTIRDIRVGAVAASLSLFMVPGILLGMVSPYAVRLKITAIDKSGETVGSLYAISTLGSIAGTFLTGFFLVAYFGTVKILFFLSALLILTSLVAYTARWIKTKIVLMVLFSLCALASNSFGAFLKGADFIDVDTPYSRVWISDLKNMGVRMMYLNGALSSSMYLKSDELVFPYTKFYRLARHFNPNIKKSLMIGGAAYSYPKDYLRQYPDARIDVVEIDPQLTDLAKKYFNLKENPRLTIYHEDGRTFLNRTKNKYDAILGDAFNAIYSIPYHLTTRQAVEKMYQALNEKGVVLINMISAIEGEKGMFLRAEYATFKSVFPQVYVFPISRPEGSFHPQNIILVALKSSEPPAFLSPDPEFQRFLEQVWKKPIAQDMPVLTDDYAPVDKFVLKMLPQKFKKKTPLLKRIQSLLGLRNP